MPETHHSQPSKTVTLEALLRVKRAERPPAEFWDGFEEKLHQRILREVVAEPKVVSAESWVQRSRRLWLAVPVAAAIMVMVWSSGGPGVMVEPQGPALELATLGDIPPVAAEPTGGVSPRAVEAQFVSDQLASAVARPASSFTRVLASEMLAAAPAAAVYVANPIGRTGDLDFGSPTSGLDRF